MKASSTNRLWSMFRTPSHNKVAVCSATPSRFNEFGQPQTKILSGDHRGQVHLFMLANKHGLQGVAYERLQTTLVIVNLLITDGFDLQQAIQNSLNADQFSS
jgi:hypothetical protein